MVRRIPGLTDDPRPPGSQKLAGGDEYRVRQGAYRIVYSIADAVVTVEAFGEAARAALPHLEKAVRDEDERVASSARRAIARIRGEAAPSK